MFVCMRHLHTHTPTPFIKHTPTPPPPFKKTQTPGGGQGRLQGADGESAGARPRRPLPRRARRCVWLMCW